MEVFVYREDSFVCISEVLKKNNAKTAGVVLKKDEFLAISTPELFSAFVDSFNNSAGVDAIEESLRSIESSLDGLEGIFTLRVEEDLKINLDVIDGDEVKNLEEEGKDLDSGLIRQEIGGGKTIVLDKGGNIVITKILDIWRDIKRFFKGKSSLILLKASKLVTPVKEKFQEIFSNKKIFKKVEAQISEIKFKKPDRNRKGFRVDEYKVKDLKAKRIRIAVLVFLLIVSISFLVRYIVIKRNEAEIHTLVTEQMDEVEGHLSEANDNIVKDKNSAETSLYKAREILDTLVEGISEEDVSRKQALLNEHLELEDSLLSRNAVSEEDSSLTQFLDTRLAFGEDSSPSDIVLYTDSSGNDSLYISDEGNSAVYRVAVYDKSVSTIPDSGGIVKSPKYIDYGNNGVYVYDSTQGVLYAPFNDSEFNSDFEILTGVKARDIGDESISEMAILTASDNIYLLSRDQQAIIKSSSIGSGYGLTYSYIESDTFSEASDFFSDFTIYVLKPGSDGLETYLYSYITTEYSYSEITLTGLRTDIVNLTKGYTTGSLDFGLYVFDATQKRFIKFEKPQEGEDIHPGEEVLKAQYVYRGDEEGVFSEIKDFCC